MVENLKKSIMQIKSTTKTSIVVACGISAYKELQNELSLSDKQMLILSDGTPIYYLEWFPADKIVIGGPEILKKPDWFISDLDKRAMSNDLLPVVTEREIRRDNLWNFLNTKTKYLVYLTVKLLKNCLIKF